MRKLLLCFFSILCLTCCKVQCQNTQATIRYQRDSLDKVQPLDMPKVRTSGKAYVIKVKNQEQFDALGKQITEAIKAGQKNIVVKIGKGTFQFHENHIVLNQIKDEDISIAISGCHTVITSDNAFLESSYCTSPWGELTTANRLIEVVDDTANLCKIPFSNTMTTAEAAAFCQVQIPQWFKAPIYPIERIDHSGIYFIAPELKFLSQFGRKGYNVNYDYLYAGKTPRFRLYDKSKERTCLASCFLRACNTTLKCITLQGISFKSNKEGSSLIAMSAVEASKVLIRKCTFDYIKSKVASFSGTGNVMFDKNTVTHTNGDELTFNGGCKNVRVTNSHFENCGTGLGNTVCVRCNGAEYYIANNTFCNFGYSAIGVGLWYGHEKKHDVRGIIEHNEICFTENYFVHREKYTLMDAGAIYVWTQNDDAIIRYNYIHNYGGMRFNSGIYCDDGASNCKIYGNVVLNTPDGCSITSRMVKDLKPTFKNNANNFMAYNVVDGAVVFSGYDEEDRHCVKGANYVLPSGSNSKYTTKLGGLELNEEDIEIQSIQEVQKFKEFKNFKVKIKN